MDSIIIKGARVNNLKNIDVTIPRNQLVVITGLSGSGKSSLAHDTIYAEGQRRYVESLSSYARQFLGRIQKPEVDLIHGIPPAIAIEQKVNTRNPRSTVGTSTEIYDYIKLLFARIGVTYSPVSGEVVKKDTVSDVVNYILSLPDDTAVMVMVPLGSLQKEKFAVCRQTMIAQGYSRVEINGVISRLEDAPSKIKSKDEANLIVDRIRVTRDEESSARYADSVQTAFNEGDGRCGIKFQVQSLNLKQEFSNRFERDGIIFEEPNEHLFSFNSPYGACPRCDGFGKVIGIDEDLVVPDKSMSVYQDAVVCWKGEIMSEWKNKLVYEAERLDFPIHKPYSELNEKQLDILWRGTAGWQGIDGFFRYLDENKYKIQYRVMTARYSGKTVCPDCKGGRLRKESTYVKVNGMTVNQLVLLPIDALHDWFMGLSLNEHQQLVAQRILTEIINRLEYLMEVGLSYLTLNRLSSTLSGGEAQRINLATSLGSSLVGSLYILDEPSIGLHPRDTAQLIGVLKKLQALGNTVLVVEHDEEVMRASDRIIDIGPFAGRAGGQVVFEGTCDELMDCKIPKFNDSKIIESLNQISLNYYSLTAEYLTGRKQITVPAQRRKWNNYIQLSGARANNLKNITVRFPLNVLCVVTGVSGSGKSTLVHDILFPTLQRELTEVSSERAGAFDKITGDLFLLKAVEFVDQNPIGRSSRSNPVTYSKAYDEIRKLFAEQPQAIHNDLKPSHFSFNIQGGRCEECQGEGEITVEMQFMADVKLVCEACNGKKFKEDVLEVTWKNKNIYDVLECTVDEAIEFFGQNKKRTLEQKIMEKLKPLSDVGLGYVKLGQSSSTLSGGESQRVKLATFITGGKSGQPTLFIFDEPTTGLHFHDIRKLLDAFNMLIENGHSVLVIEHNPEIIKCADWVIDLGPEGGNGGGNIVCCGTPETVAACGDSYTGRYLKTKV